MENVLIDTDVAIEYLRSKDKASTTLIRLLKKFDVFASAITEFELYMGAKTDLHVKDLIILFHEIEVLPFDFGCGRIASDIWKKVQEKHQHAEIKDIFIASIAIQNNFTLCTFNKKHFKSIPNIKLWDENCSKLKRFNE